MTTANTERGEIEVTVDGTVYVARPSFKALQSIERQCGPVVEIIRRAISMSVPLGDLTYILHQGILAGSGPRNSPKYDEVGEAVIGMGVIASTELASEMLSSLIKGSDNEDEHDQEKE